MKIARRFNGGSQIKQDPIPCCRRPTRGASRAFVDKFHTPRSFMQFINHAVTTTQCNAPIAKIHVQSSPMSHRYESLLVHSIFSTKDRRPLIPKDIRPRLWAYIGGIAKTNSFKALAVGGIEDHVHVLLSLPATLAVAKAIQLIKGGSSKWMNDKPGRRSFAWQDSYGVFTVGISQVESTLRYINNQEHHLRVGYEDEFRKILQRHGIREFKG
ncbi:MAG TPA: IS200/IS605 family transposase [Terriglobales bacterium]|nr:IS200/IS605 family transposase [Terriglobales bacterium]